MSRRGEKPASSPAPDMRSRVIRGLRWKAFSQVSVQAMALVTTIFIAHLLTPSEVGLVAMATVFSSLAMMFSDLALGAALVQRDTLTEEDRSTAFWLNAGFGTLLMLAGFVLAAPIARLYGEPDLEPLFQVISVTFLLTSLGTTQNALLIREMSFRSLEARTVVASGLGGATAIALAFLGVGAWAIVGQKLAVNGASTILVWRASSWRPRRVFSRRSARDLFGFSGFLVGTRFLWYLDKNADNYLIGRYVGAAALGAYSIAYNVMLVPLTRLASPIEEVFYPAFSRLRERERIGPIWLRSTRMVCLILVPAFAGMAVVAPFFVRVVLGDQWEESIAVLEILCWVGILQAVSFQTFSVLQAVDRTSLIFRFALISTLITVVGFAVGVRWGIVGVATASAITTTLVTPFLIHVSMRHTGVTAGRLLGMLRGVAEATILMVGVLVALRLTVLDSMHSFAALFVAVTVGVAVYVPAAAWRCPEAFAELRGLRRRPPRPSELPTA